MKYILLSILHFLPLFLFSQTTFIGVVLDQDKQPIEKANAFVSSRESKEIIAYGITDKNGRFSINFKSIEDSVFFQIRSMGFKSIDLRIINQNFEKEFILHPGITELKEVIIKSPPIAQRGDTISYNVNSFASEKDRSIADVLKRLPGIEVQSDGQILYQGKPINKYYINGMDLLEGRYNLANKNLPYSVVTNVQVLENHQPIKVLDSIEFSEHAALNIELKNKHTFTGQVSGGFGLSPLLWNVNITPMLFAQNKQTIVSYQSNNTGENISRQLKRLTIEDIIEGFENNTDKKDWLAIEHLNTPRFSENRWLDNKTHLFSANLLHKLNNEYELRYQISYLNDFQKHSGYTKTTFYTPDYDVLILENKINKLSYNNLEAEIALQRNTKNNYLKNELNVQSSWNSRDGLISSEEEKILQSLSDKYFKLTNKFKAILPIGSQLLELNSFVSIHQAPEELEVMPGKFESILNENNSYEKMYQKVELTSFFTNNYVGFKEKLGYFSLFNKIGFQLENQNLESSLSIDENILGNDFFNDLRWEQSKAYLQIKTQFRKNKWRIELNSPIEFHSYHIEDKKSNLGQNSNKMIWDPRLSISKDLTTYWKVNGSIGLRHNFGTIDRMYYAYILQSYRNLQRMNAPLLEVKTNTASGSISYRNPIQSLFGNITYVYFNSEQNLLYSNNVLPSGAIEVNAILQNNIIKNNKISARLSKYLSALRTNFTVLTEYATKNYSIILNENLSDIKNYNNKYGAEVDIDFTDWFNVEYQTSYAFTNNYMQNQSNYKTRQQSHQMHLNFYFSSLSYLGVKTEYVSNYLSGNKEKNVFSDISYRYSIKERNIDFELHFTNIFNTRNYRSVHLNDFSYIETSYDLRPRQILFKVRFAI